MRHSKISIKWKIYSYLFGFTLILLALLWLFQVAYLDVFYENIKQNQLDEARTEVEAAVEDAEEDLEGTIKDIAEEYNISIVVADSDGNSEIIEQASNTYINNIVLSKFDILSYAKQSQNTDNENTINGVYDFETTYEKLFTNITKSNIDIQGFLNNDSEDISSEDSSGNDTDSTDTITNEPESTDANTDQPESADANTDGSESTDTNTDESESTDTNTDVSDTSDIEFSELESNTKIKIQATVVDDDNGEQKTIILMSVMTPVQATVQTLEVQLVYITAILIVLSLIIALLISRRVSKSIIKVNKSALKLAQGDYNVKFTGTDYKEISELSNTLNVAASELAKTESLQRELIANVSHDLRTPLTMIIGYSEVMRDLPGENTPENVQVVIDESKRLANLVNDLLDISRIQSGVTPFETRTYDLTKSIEEVMERYSKLVQQNGYKVIFEYNEHIFVNADEEKIFQVVYNLVNNAINYIGEDKTVIVRQIINRDKVRIEVIDHGIGIDEDNLEHVWQRYYRGDKEHNRAIMGTGLGLAIVENILRLHNAQYGVDSKFGHGSTFWFEIKYEK